MAVSKVIFASYIKKKHCLLMFIECLTQNHPYFTTGDHFAKDASVFNSIHLNQFNSENLICPQGAVVQARIVKKNMGKQDTSIHPQDTFHTHPMINSKAGPCVCYIII